jgi:hypothetical protein
MASAWQPIDTAPHDQTLIGWCDGWQEPELIYRIGPTDIWQEGRYGDYVDLGFEPTYWMPLPEPPEDTKEVI